MYPEDKLRSKIMGIILGSIALGVLLGYPFGGILYDFMGKSAPFSILSSLIFIVLLIQFMVMDFDDQSETDQLKIEHVGAVKSKYGTLLKNKLIIAIVVAIWISTSTMAILEPCLPIWLLTHLKPKKWQLGTVFIPDSLGYFIGTNFFGSIAYNFGQIRATCLSLILIGLSCFFVSYLSETIMYIYFIYCNRRSQQQPQSHTYFYHTFVLVLESVWVDAALVPLLASLVDSYMRADEDDTGSSNYGTVYAIQQTSVSLAYSLGPLLGGELAEWIGFPSLMTIMGILNIFYGPVLIEVFKRSNRPTATNEILLHTSRGSNYKTLGADLP